MEINKKKEELQINKSNVKILNTDEIDSDTFKTKKKSFVSEINPHLIRRNIQKEEYIWYGVYDELVRNKIMINLL